MKEIRTIDNELLNSRAIITDYTDGDVTIIDNVKNLKDISPLKPDVNFIILCTCGRIQFDLNGHLLLLEANNVLLSAPGVILNNYMFSPDFECKILCLTDSIIRRLLRSSIEVWNQNIYINKRTILPLPDENVEQFQYYYWMIRQKIKQKGRTYQKESLHCILQGMLLDLLCLANQPTTTSEASKFSHGRVIFDQFLRLLTHSETKRKQVWEYSKMLNITPKYLTVVCLEYSQQSASNWINQYTKEDITYYLKNSDLAVKEIADRLGFCNNSQFGTYVRRHFGMSPLQLRKQLTSDSSSHPPIASSPSSSPS